MVEGARLEIVYTATYRGFESLSLRHQPDFKPAFCRTNTPESRTTRGFLLWAPDCVPGWCNRRDSDCSPVSSASAKPPTRPALRRLASALNPHRYHVIYLAETGFGRTDLYRCLALALGIEPAYRRARLWRDLKARILEQVDLEKAVGQESTG